MTLPRLTAAVLSLTLLVTACSDDGDSGVINLSDGLEPSLADIQTESNGENVVGLSYATFDGEAASFDDRLGTPMVINFFAEWCAPCVQEMPEFQSVSQELVGVVDFVGISIDKGAADALALVEATGVTYDIGWDPSEELFAHFQGLSMPTTAFVDASGRITRVWSGVLDADSLREKIEEEIL